MDAYLRQGTQKEKAQGMVEFALVLPILLLLILGIIEFGRLLFIYSAVTSASREAARYGAAVGGCPPRYQDCTGIREAAKRIGGIVGITDADVLIEYDDGSTVYPGTCPPSAQVSLADRIIVTISGNFQPIVPLVNIPPIPIVSITVRTILKDIGIRGTPAPTDIPSETGVPVLQVVKVVNHYDDIDGDGFISPGDILEYGITITNTSTHAAGDFGLGDIPDANTTLIVGSVTSSVGTIEDGNTAGDTSVLISDGTLAGSSTATVGFRVEINSPFPSGMNSVSNQAYVSATDIAIVWSNEVVTTVIAGPYFTAEKSASLQNDADGSGSLSPDDTLRYTVEISNDGNADATNVVYADTPGVNTALVVGSVNVSDGSVNQGNMAGDTTVEVDLGTIQQDDSVIITYDVTIDDPFPEGVSGVYNQGVVSCDELSTDTLTDDPATEYEDDITFAGVINTKSVEITKADSLFVDIGGDGNVSPGDTLKYVIAIENTGLADITGIVFSDSPGSYLTLVAGSVTTNKGSVVSSSGNVQVDAGTLVAGQQATITFQVKIDDSLPEGVTQVSNQGEVSNNELPNQNTDDPDTPAGGDATVTTVGATIVLDMEATKEDLVSGVVYPGDTIEYRVVIANTGDGDVTGIVFSDSPGSYLTLVPGSVIIDKGSDASSGGNVQVDVGTLIPGEQATITFTVEVASSIPGTVTEVSNQGDISSPDLLAFQTDDPDVGGSNDPTTTTITLLPVCAVTIRPFSTANYKVTWEIENTGNQDLRLYQLGVEFPDGNSEYGQLEAIAFEDPIWIGGLPSPADIFEENWNQGVEADRNLFVGSTEKKLLALTFDKKGTGLQPYLLAVYLRSLDGTSCSVYETWVPGE